MIIWKGDFTSAVSPPGYIAHMSAAAMLALFVSCAGDAVIPPGCGDGVLEGAEACDDGEANSSTLPDACRSDCTLPFCGDGVTDRGEDCDDSNDQGGDGCTPTCLLEDGLLEEEPNDSPAEAQQWNGQVIYGSLAQGDVDCFAVELPGCGAIQAWLGEPCPAPATLALHDPEGSLLAVGAPAEDGCAYLDPEQAPGARFVDEGQWTLCLSPILDAALSSYALEIRVVQPEDASYTIDTEQDPDGDGVPDDCDSDRDGDGVTNEDDNCPDIPNGPDMAALSPSEDGYLRVWLAAGPFAGTESTQDCLPSYDNLLGDDDASVEPSLGQDAGDAVWTVLWSWEDRVDYLEDFATVDAPREIYTAVYVHSEAQRELTLALGPDDGVRAWLNGDLLMEESGCQGTVVDYFSTQATLLAGWNLVLLKVRDQGGEWGIYARFKDDGEPITDLELSLSPDGTWESNQEDSDADGIGDVCDSSP